MNPGAANRTGFRVQKPPQFITITVVFCIAQLKKISDI